VSRLTRFLRIERSRSEAPVEPVDPGGATAERFEGLEQPGHAPGPPTASGADLDRFSMAPSPSIELASTDAARRPFTRCMRCGMDHNVSVTECTGCGASLATPEQRDFNERLWGQRQAEKAAEDRMLAEREELRARDAVEQAAAQRAMGEALAREVGDRERQRLGREGLDAADWLLVAIASGFASAGRWVWRRISGRP
jgi:hypothetical protein